MPRLAKPILFATCAWMAAQACAESPAPSRKQAAVATAAPAAAANVAAIGKASGVAAATTIAAAGSIIVVADGIVVHAAMASIQPPAQGFVYER